eukprot:77634_1
MVELFVASAVRHCVHHYPDLRLLDGHAVHVSDVQRCDCPGDGRLLMDLSEETPDVLPVCRHGSGGGGSSGGGRRRPTEADQRRHGPESQYGPGPYPVRHDAFRWILRLRKQNSRYVPQRGWHEGCRLRRMYRLGDGFGDLYSCLLDSRTGVHERYRAEAAREHPRHGLSDRQRAHHSPVRVSVRARLGRLQLHGDQPDQDDQRLRARNLCHAPHRCRLDGFCGGRLGDVQSGPLRVLDEVGRLCHAGARHDDLPRRDPPARLRVSHRRRREGASRPAGGETQRQLFARNVAFIYRKFELIIV